MIQVVLMVCSLSRREKCVRVMDEDRGRCCEFRVINESDIDHPNYVVVSDNVICGRGI